VRIIERVGGWGRGAPGTRVAVLVSGGVDSAAAAALLLREGYDVVGVTMRIPRCVPGGGASGPDPERTLEGVRELSRLLGIPHVSVDVDDEFRAFVTDPFRVSYASGRTPNPCSDCNARVKFGVLMDFAERELGASFVASGHYARIRTDARGGFALLRAADRARDQSYFLAGISGDRLGRILFPLGDRRKNEARTIAAEARLPVATASDSMEICFVGQGNYRQAVGDLSREEGDFVAADGRVLGRHGGIPFYTVGQRKGLGLALPEPLYVSRIDPGTNRIFLVPRERIFRRFVDAVDVNLLLPELFDDGSTAGSERPLAGKIRSLAGKIRSQGEPLPCSVVGYDGKTLRVAFEPPAFAPAPGQRLVLYEGERVAAGAVIAGADDGGGAEE
jgi:tRNA-specific 2-thiouridylase